MFDVAVAISGWLTFFTFLWVGIALGMQAWKNWIHGGNGNDWLDARYQLERWRVWLVQGVATDDTFTYLSRAIGTFPAKVLVLLSHNPKASRLQVIVAIVCNFIELAVLTAALLYVRPLLIEYVVSVQVFVAAAVFLMGWHGAHRNEGKYRREGTKVASWQLAISRLAAYISTTIYFLLTGKAISALLYVWLAYRQFRVVQRFLYSQNEKEE